MRKKLIKQTITSFEAVFKKKPERIFLAPGRINIIGEHLDYNDGFVLPAAINKYICFAFSQNDNLDCVLIAKDLEEEYRFNINDELKPVNIVWVNYILGVVHLLKAQNLIPKGFNVLFSSSIPMGAGLSSSAALECGMAFALNTMNHFELAKKELATIGQQAEHIFAGVKCGIMDQFASVFGKKNHAILLDCTSLEFNLQPIDFKDYTFLLLDSCVKHSHLTSGYNDRRNEVDKGIELLRKHFPEITSFRNCTELQIESIKEKLGIEVFKRCLYVVQEIERIEKAVVALHEGKIEILGELITKTHYGLSELYEVSCEEMDFLVKEAKKHPEIIGARMMGGGFGGCTLNLIRKDKIESIIDEISVAYKSEFNIDLKSYKVEIAEGIHEYVQ